jgi:hypothetical protein
MAHQFDSGAAVMTRLSRLSGSCLCGSVRYQISGKAVRFYHCHCRRCRKATGTGHASNLLVTPLASLTWLAGEELLRRYEDETERMAAERQPPSADAVLRAGTRQQLVERYGLRDEDFAD